MANTAMERNQRNQMSAQKNPARSGNPLRRKQVTQRKSNSPLSEYLKSLRFIKNVFIGCVYPGITVIATVQNQWPNWLYIPITVTFLLFPFAKVTLERIGLHIAPASFWRKLEDRSWRYHRFSLEIIFWLIISLLALPLAVAYFIHLTFENHPD